jgi:hypothetical protein
MIGNLNKTQWYGLLTRTDSMVDVRFGEPIEFHPWSGATVSSPGVPDPNRPVLITVGIYVTAGANAIGEISSGAAGGSQTQLEQDVWASVQSINLGNYATTWKANDRVYFPDRNEWFQVNFIPPSGTLRPDIKLLRLNEAALLALQRMLSTRFYGKTVTEIIPRSLSTAPTMRTRFIEKPKPVRKKKNEPASSRR